MRPFLWPERIVRCCHKNCTHLFRPQKGKNCVVSSLGKSGIENIAVAVTVTKNRAFSFLSLFPSNLYDSDFSFPECFIEAIGRCGKEAVQNLLELLSFTQINQQAAMSFLSSLCIIAIPLLFCHCTSSNCQVE